MSDIFRTLETESEYQLYKDAGGLDVGCDLCDKPSTKEFNHWRIVLNIFPYDGIAKTHDMLIPKRHVKEVELTENECEELVTIKNTFLDKQYEYIVEATHGVKSIPAHHHLHLLVAKKY